MTQEKEYIVFKGKCKWAKILSGQEVPPMEPDEKNKNNLDFTISVECSEKKFKSLQDKGLYNKYELRKDDETGDTYINLKSAKQRTKDTGALIVFDDLKVIDEYRNPVPVDKKVGNGSTVIAIAELLEGKAKILKGKKVLYLRCVQVLDHQIWEGAPSIQDFDDLGLLAEMPERSEIGEDNDGEDDEGNPEDYL